MSVTVSEKFAQFQELFPGLYGTRIYFLEPEEIQGISDILFEKKI